LRTPCGLQARKQPYRPAAVASETGHNQRSQPEIDSSQPVMYLCLRAAKGMCRRSRNFNGGLSACGWRSIRNSTGICRQARDSLRGGPRCRWRARHENSSPTIPASWGWCYRSAGPLKDCWSPSLAQLCVHSDRRLRLDTEIVMLDPWIFGLESVHQAWRAQSAMAFRLVRLFGGSDPDPTTSSRLISDTVAVDIKAQEDGPATVADVTKAPAAIADVPRREVSKASRVSKKASRVKPRIVSKRAAAARTAFRTTAICRLCL
jgi:hypothetical protein